MHRRCFAAGLLALLVAVTGAMTSPSPADAFFGLTRETCKDPVIVRGTPQRSMSAARGTAIGAWQQQAARRHGRGFADWYYSGDRQIDCSWDKSGRHFQCRAMALPCGRRR